MFKSRTQILKDAVQDWQVNNLLDAETADRLRQDLAAGPDERSFRFSSFIVIAGVICIFFAALSFVAANWEDMPRLTRLALLVGTMWAAWLAGVVARTRGSYWLAEAFLALGAGMFGANIMLIAQLYHIQGEPTDAVWMWAVGATLAAGLTRSPLTLWGAIALWFTWLIFLVGDASRSDGWTAVLPYLLPFVVLCGLTWWMHSRLGAHLLVLSFLVWELCAMVVGRYGFETIFPVITVAHLALVSILIVLCAYPRVLRGFERSLIFYALAASLLSSYVAYLAMGEQDWNADYTAALLALLVVPIGLAATRPGRTSPYRYDIWVSAGMLAVAVLVLLDMTTDWLGALYTLSVSIWITRMGWRFGLRRLRVLGIVGFIAATMIVYGKTVLDSLLGTSGFFLGAGVVLLASAYAAHLISKSAQEVTA